jgi:hypothetical protein
LFPPCHRENSVAKMIFVDLLLSSWFLLPFNVYKSVFNTKLNNRTQFTFTHSTTKVATTLDFYILLTVHHVMILGKWRMWRTSSFLCIYFYF